MRRNTRNTNLIKHQKAAFSGGFFVLFLTLVLVLLPARAYAEEAWPQAPDITSESAILMDMDSQTLLFDRNIYDRMYPASTTKLMTCLVAAESLSMDDTVTFSYDAIHSVPWDGSNIGMDVGESLCVEECLYGIMVGSANECANAIAEKTAGSVEAFVQLMNERAEALGCRSTHFVNANGLYDDNHYTCAYDLALIGRAFLENDALSIIGNTASHHFAATATQPDDFTIINKHKLINGEVPCTGVLGGKTGFTSQSGETLVTGCERNGMRLICVVMKTEDPNQFLDTAALFDYGFGSFKRESAGEKDTAYSVPEPSFMKGSIDLTGSSRPAVSVSDSPVTLPKDVAFSDLTSSLDGNLITYSYAGHELGRAVLLFQTKSVTGREREGLSFQADPGTAAGRVSASLFSRGITGVLYINLPLLLLWFLALALVISLVLTFLANTIHRFYGIRETMRPGQARPRVRHNEYTSHYSDHRRYGRPDELEDNYYDDDYPHRYF